MNQHVWWRFMETKRPHRRVFFATVCLKRIGSQRLTRFECEKRCQAPRALLAQRARALEDERRPEPRRSVAIPGLQFADGLELGLPQGFGGS